MVAISPARGFIQEHVHYADDAGFWQAHADRLGGLVVDLGSAAGRVAIPLALANHSVWAVDADPEMLCVLEERARVAGVSHLIECHVGDLARPTLPPSVSLVIIAMNTLQVLHDEHEHLTCLTACAAALRPGGEVILDVAMPAFDDVLPNLGVEITQSSYRDPDTGTLVTQSAVYEFADPTSGTLSFRIIIERHTPDGDESRVERVHHVHLFAPEEVRALARRSGLDVLDVHGGFQCERLSPESERHVYRLGIAE